ncbi:MAG: PssD/Cps14F family polysaccharide biosynthesis glycosyltransferase [Arcobacter sp.]
MVPLFASPNHDTDFVSICDDDVRHPVTKTVYIVSTVTDKFSYIKLLARLPMRAIRAFGVISKVKQTHNIRLVITTGPGIGVLAGLYFKWFSSARIIHIETWSRFYSKSLTGRVMYHIADDFLVQNEELLELYPKAIYKGRL